ncbi:MAG: hypothetical protein ACOX6U_07310 [Oscillospiraceae bacterium]|jgi:hypothetical protein
MRVFLWELKKIWRPWVLLATAAVLVLGYFLFVENQLVWIDYQNEGGWAGVEYTTAKTWLERYGPTLEEDERKDAEKDWEAVVDEVNAFIANSPEFAAAGIFDHNDWDDYRNTTGKFAGMDWQSQEWQEQMDVLDDLLFFENETNLGFRYQDMQSLYYSYDTRNEPFQRYGDESAAKLAWYERVDRLKEQDALRGLMPYSIVSSLQMMFNYLIILPILGVFLLLAPYPVRDRIQNLHPVFWASRTGRRLPLYQLGAALFSAFGLTTVVLTPCLIRLFQSDISTFFECSVMGFMSDFYVFGNLTLLQWIICGILLCYVFSLGTAAWVFLVSQCSKSYVPMLLKQLLLFVPLVVAAFYLAGSNMADSFNTFYLIGSLGYLTGIPGAELWVSGILLVLGVAVCLFYVWRQKKRELV